MKVCVIHSIFPPYARGGAELVAYAQAQTFVSRGHDVFAITCAPFEGGRSFAGKWNSISLMAADRRLDSHKIADPVISGYSVKHPVAIRIFRFTPFNLFTIFNIARYPLLLRMFWHILDMFNLHTYLVTRRILREEKPDLIITRNLKGLGYIVSAAIRNYIGVARESARWRGLSAATPQWFHGLHDLGALHPRGFMEWKKEYIIHNPKPPIWLYRILCRKLFGSPDAVVAPSQFVLEEYTRAGFFVKSKKVVIQNPVAPRLIHPFNKGENNGNEHFLYLGQLEPYKGLRILLNAWQDFVNEYPDAKLAIVGQGSMEDEIKKAEREIRGVEYRGFIAHDKIASVFEGARFLIMPSLAYETFGLVIAESFSAGVPVIASRIGAIPELVQNGINGFLFRPGDSQALVQTMKTALSSSWGELSQSAKKSAEEFTLEKYGEELLAFHNSLTKK